MNLKVNAPTTLFVVQLLLCASNAAISDYFKSVGSYFGYEEKRSTELEGNFEQKVPYEVSLADEKFIAQAIQLTGVAVSDLDNCQHRVVLRLHSDCNQMNDEMISKLAVQLLNCQSYVEGRKVYPCTDQMTIKECTFDMDADVWNSYHLMTNRARAVCYSIRQAQFRGLTEDTVNRLMGAAKNQLHTLDKISKDQHDLQSVAKNTLESVTDGHANLAKQQKDLHKAQLFGQLQIEDNIKRLADEKLLIIESQEEIARMARSMQEKLDEANHQMEDQAKETNDKHKELLSDLIAIKEKAQVIFQRIGDSSDLLIKQSELANEQYEATLKKLSEVNATVHSLVSLVGGTKQALEERLSWITESLGGTDEAVEKMYLILWHTTFLVFGMIACAFLGARTSTRLVLVLLVPCNLALAVYKFEHALDAVTLGLSIAAYIAAQTTILAVIALTQKLKDKKPLPLDNEVTPTNSPRKQVLEQQDNNSNHSRSNTPDRCNSELNHAASSYQSSPVSSLRHRKNSPELNYSTNEYETDYMSPTPPLSRSGYYTSRSRSNTPFTLNASLRHACGASTRIGTPCKNNSMPGRDFCHRHQKGDSIME